MQLKAGEGKAVRFCKPVPAHLCGSVQMNAASTSLTLDSPRTRLMQYVSSSLDSAAERRRQRAESRDQRRAGGGLKVWSRNSLAGTRSSCAVKQASSKRGNSGGYQQQPRPGVATHPGPP